MEHFICAVNERKKQFDRAVADTVRPADDAADGTVGSVLTEGSASSGRPNRTPPAPPAVCDARPSTPPRSLRPALAFVCEAQPAQEATKAERWAEYSPIVRSWDADGQQPDPLLVPSSLGWPGEGPGLRERSLGPATSHVAAAAKPTSDRSPSPRASAQTGGGVARRPQAALQPASSRSGTARCRDGAEAAERLRQLPGKPGLPQVYPAAAGEDFDLPRAVAEVLREKLGASGLSGGGPEAASQVSAATILASALSGALTAYLVSRGEKKAGGQRPDPSPEECTPPRVGPLSNRGGRAGASPRRSSDPAAPGTRGPEGSLPRVLTQPARTVLSRDTEDRKTPARKAEVRTVLSRETEDRTTPSRKAEVRTVHSRETEDRKTPSRKAEVRTVHSRETEDRNTPSRKAEVRTVHSGETEDQQLLWEAEDRNAALSREAEVGDPTPPKATPTRAPPPPPTAEDGPSRPGPRPAPPSRRTQARRRSAGGAASKGGTPGSSATASASLLTTPGTAGASTGPKSVTKRLAFSAADCGGSAPRRRPPPAGDEEAIAAIEELTQAVTDPRALSVLSHALAAVRRQQQQQQQRRLYQPAVKKPPPRASPEAPGLLGRQRHTPQDAARGDVQGRRAAPRGAADGGILGFSSPGLDRSSGDEALDASSIKGDALSVGTGDDTGDSHADWPAGADALNPKAEPASQRQRRDSPSPPGSHPQRTPRIREFVPETVGVASPRERAVEARARLLREQRGDSQSPCGSHPQRTPRIREFVPETVGVASPPRGGVEARARALREQLGAALSPGALQNASDEDIAARAAALRAELFPAAADAATPRRGQRAASLSVSPAVLSSPLEEQLLGVGLAGEDPTVGQGLMRWPQAGQVKRHAKELAKRRFHSYRTQYWDTIRHRIHLRSVSPERSASRHASKTPSPRRSSPPRRDRESGSHPFAARGLEGIFSARSVAELTAELSKDRRLLRDTVRDLGGLVGAADGGALAAEERRAWSRVADRQRKRSNPRQRVASPPSPAKRRAASVPAAPSDFAMELSERLQRIHSLAPGRYNRQTPTPLSRMKYGDP